MRRRTFDALASVTGGVLVVILLVAGALLTWAHSYVHDQVHTQLAAQQIFFPAKGSEAISDPQIKPYLTQYAGQQLINGDQAKAYANHFIAVHLKAIGHGKTYSQVSEQFLAMKPTDPNYQAVCTERATLFQGQTLRGLLLNAYAFDTIGYIAGIAAVVSFAGAGVMLLLVGLGVWHLRRTPDGTELHLGTPVKEHAHS